jgi:hypothetical protein
MQQQMVLYGVGTQSTSNFEEDHLVPLSLGGAPQDPRNMFPMALSGTQNAHDKQVVENTLHSAVCGGQLALQLAQRYIAGDWTNALSVLGLAPKATDLTTPGTSTGGSSSSGSSSSTTGQSSGPTALPSGGPVTPTATPVTPGQQPQLPPALLPPPPPPPAGGQTLSPY